MVNENYPKNRNGEKRFALCPKSSARDRIIFRSLAEGGGGRRVGCGFMRKEGARVDQLNIRPSSYSLVYVIRGRGLYRDKEGREWPLGPGSLFQRYPGRLHSTLLEPDSAWSECFIDLPLPLYEALISMRIIRPGEPPGRLSPGSGADDEIRRIMCRLEEAKEREIPRCGMEILQLTASLLERSEGRVDDEADPLWHMVESSCQDFSVGLHRRLDLKEYCRSWGWGYESFRKIFAEKVGMPPGQYIIQRRMDEACRLLRSGHLSIKETSRRLGYKSPYEFSAQFRRMIGCSPTVYRAPFIPDSVSSDTGES